MSKHIYDIIIIGGGPAGYTSALYGARAGFDVLVLERLCAGGQMALSSKIDNYPGFEDGIDGFSLGEKMQSGAEKFGAKTEIAEVYSLELDSKIKKVETSEGDFFARTVIIATGANPKELGLENENELLGYGVHYCASCDGMFYKNKTVAVVGGGNSAVEDASILSRICEKVYIIHRRDTLKATKVYHDKLLNTDNVEIVWNSSPKEFISQDGQLCGVVVEDVKTGDKKTINCEAVFVSIGRKPATELVKDKLSLDESGYIIADESTKTSAEGVFAVGDVRTKALRQVVTAVADGATAIHYIEEYLA